MTINLNGYLSSWCAKSEMSQSLMTNQVLSNLVANVRYMI